MPPSQRREPPSEGRSSPRTETAIHRLGPDVGFTSSAPSVDVVARLHRTKPRVLSAPLPITPSSSPMPAEFAPALTANAELLCEFPFRPNLKKYRLMRGSRIVDVFCIPRGDFVSYLSSKPAPSVQVLLVPSSLQQQSNVGRHGAKERTQTERTDDTTSAGDRDPDGVSEKLRTSTAAGSQHRSAWRSPATWPRRMKPPDLTHTDTYADYARLGLTTALPTLSPGVLEGTAIVFAPIALGEPREKWPTTIPLPGLRRVVMSFRPTRAMSPGPWVEHLLRLHKFDQPVRETVVLFRAGAQLEEEPENGDGLGHAWLGELLVTLFEGVPSHNLGAVTIVGLKQAAPGWPSEQHPAAAQLERLLSHSSPQLSPKRDWSDVKAARFLSLEAYEATITPAEFELETCPV